MSTGHSVQGVMINDMSFSQRLRQLRLERDLTQAEVAKAISVDKGYVSSWETGRSKPSLDSVLALSKFFGVSLDYLMFENVPREGVEAINDFELYDFFRKTEALPKEKKEIVKGVVNAIVLAEKIKELPEWSDASKPKEAPSASLRKVAGKR